MSNQKTMRVERVEEEFGIKLEEMLEEVFKQGATEEGIREHLQDSINYLRMYLPPTNCKVKVKKS